MNKLLLVLSGFFLSVSAFAQSQGVSLRATNGISFGELLVNNHINATNTGTTNTFAGKFKQGSGTTANGTGAASFGQNTASGGTYSFSVGIGNQNTGAGAIVSGNSNTITGSATGSSVSGRQNRAQDANEVVSGYNVIADGSNTFAHGLNITINNLAHNDFVIGQNIEIESGASNNFVWNGNPSVLLSIPTSRSNAFTVTAPGGIFLNGPVTLPAGGVSVYASNVVSGGVLPAGTVSASTATAGYVLATDGTLRQWTNRVSLAQIDGIGGTGSTNLVTGGIVSTNANVANTRLILNGAQNGAVGSVINYTSNNVSIFNVTSSGDVAPAGSITLPSSKNLNLASSGQIAAASRATIDFPSTGVVRITSSAGGGADLIALSGLFTNGITSYRSNLLVAANITVGASPSSWTNTLSPTCSVNVYVDSSLGATTVGQNGATLFGSFAGTQTVGLQPGEYVTFTYLATAPTAKFKPFP